MTINWEKADSLFESQYWGPEKGKGYSLVVTNWRLEERKKYEKNPDDRSEEEHERETVLSFDLLKIDTREYRQGEKVWRSGSRRLYETMKPILKQAEGEKRKEVAVYVELTTDNHYRILDLLKVRGSLPA